MVYNTQSLLETVTDALARFMKEAVDPRWVGCTCAPLQKLQVSRTQGAIVITLGLRPREIKLAIWM